MLDIIHKIADAIPTGAAVAAIGGVVDFLLRYVPTEKPLSIAHVIADGFHALANLFQKLGDLLDKILPQKLSPPKQ